jgi:hypothetical protein
MPFSSQTFGFFSVSASSNINGETKEWGHRGARQTNRGEDGQTTVRTFSQKLGQDPVLEERRYDKEGRQLIADNESQQQQHLRHPQGRIEDVSDQK